MAVNTPTCLAGTDLLRYSRNPELLLTFLRHHQGRIGMPAPTLKKNIIVLVESPEQTISSHLHVIGSPGQQLPMIERTGIFPPSMHVAEFATCGGAVTTNANEQRVGCDYVNLHMAVTYFVERLADVAEGLSATGIDDKVSEKVEPILRAHSEPEKVRKLREVISVMRNDMSGLLKAGRDGSGALCELGDHDSFITSIFDLFATDVPDLERSDFDRLFHEAWRASVLSRKPPALADIAFDRALITFLKAGLSGIHMERHKKAMINAGSPPTHIVLQGCGDVSMNLWHVAAVKQEAMAAGNRLIHARHEDLESRQYSCLIAFADRAYARELQEKAGPDQDYVISGNLGIGRVSISRYLKNDHQVQLITRHDPTSIGDQIEYVTYGQRLAREGRVVDPSEIVSEFADIRHLIDMPNINPDSDSEKMIRECYKLDIFKDSFDGKEQFSDSPDRLIKAIGNRPRYLFGISATENVWLGERAFLRDPQLLRVACDHPVEIPLYELGAPLAWVTVCLTAANNNFHRRHFDVRNRGDFAWNCIDPTNPKLTWFPRKAVYPATMVGLGALKVGVDQNQKPLPPQPAVYLLAWGHKFNQDQSYNIFECAQMLCDLGAQSVLLIDEGQDVFQYFFKDLDDYDRYRRAKSTEKHNEPVRGSRSQVRGSLCFWVEPRPESKGETATE